MQQRLAFTVSLTALPLLTAVLLADPPPLGSSAPAASQPGTGSSSAIPAASGADQSREPVTVRQTLDDLLARVEELEASHFTVGRKKLFASRLATAIHRLERGHDLAAASQLRSLLRTTDGCVATSRPDRNDWVLDCETQESLHRRLLEARRGLEEG